MHMNHSKRIPTLREQGLWNAAAGFLCALEAVIMEMVATRFLNLAFTGELTIAFAFGNLFRTIGLWGTRSYHLSDINYDYNFEDYKKSRIFSMVLMSFVILVYVSYLLFFL